MRTIKQGWLEYAYDHKIAIAISLLTVVGCLIVYVYFGGPGDPGPGNPGDSSGGFDVLSTLVEKLEFVPETLVYGGANSMYNSPLITKVYGLLMQCISDATDILLQEDFGTVGQEYWIQYYLNPVVKEFYLFFHLCAKVANASGSYIPTEQITTFTMPYLDMLHATIYGLHHLTSVTSWSLAGQTIYMMVTFGTKWAKSVAPDMFYDLVELLDLVKGRDIFAKIQLDRYPDVVDILPRHLFDHADLIHHFIMV